MSRNDSDLDLANPHALAAIVEASSKRSIVASQDIVDERGVKLWARGQPVSESLQQRLLERKLKQPLETSLYATDGVNELELKAAVEVFLLSDHPMARALQPWCVQVIDGVARLSVQPAAQLLLTAAQAARPGVFDHAVRGMALAGAVALAGNHDESQTQLALMGGLLHDLGEMYVSPEYLNPTKPLDLNGYRHVVVHPRIGSMLLSRLTSYPASLARAVGEHHERMDGSGYPARLASKAISPLGRLLAVVEATLGITASTPAAPWAHASFALRMVPGEFEGSAVGFVSAAAHRAAEDLGIGDEAQPLGLSQVDGRLAAALVQAQQVATRSTSSECVRAVAERAGLLLFRLRAGWNEMGLWAANPDGAPLETRFEMQLAERELAYRMRFIRRECLWPEKEMAAADAEALTPLWAALEPPAAT